MFKVRMFLCLMAVCSVSVRRSFAFHPQPMAQRPTTGGKQYHRLIQPAISSSSNGWMVILCSSNNPPDYDDDNRSGDDEDQNTPVGQMKVSEIKAELELRDISYDDCFDRDSLAERLREARTLGQANPKILDTFNKQTLEQQFDTTKKVPISDADISSAVANDGTLPGGFRPEEFRGLSSNPKLIDLLRNTKTQEAMRVVMEQGPKGLEAVLLKDPKMMDTIGEIGKILEEEKTRNPQKGNGVDKDKTVDEGSWQ